ncbi:DUF3667 domain-containing protein [Marinimicrobium alkaliphilum]|uniref:DUF3667 domain-containing protein n=1 Tax=Marinimicrobium alkaliphilum TaxID=2202654 RepID=UPI000DB9FFB9|nr:DUF3667 domain-containing protein [Marinimicrobium alkaliphilum]
MVSSTSASSCSNCGEDLQGPFCHQCGQDDKQYTRSLLRLIPEFFGELSNWDNRLWRTLAPLWIRPGYLSRRYVDGHRAPYVPPLRLYIFTSIVAFLVFALAIPYEPPTGIETGAAPAFGAPSVHLPILSEDLNASVNTKLARLIENPELGISRFFSLAPQVMFLLLPMLALLLKVIYLSRRHYYIEHLILALHSHSFLLQWAMLAIGFAKLIALVQPWPAIAVALGWLFNLYLWSAPIYLLLSQKAFYRQSWGITLVKFSAIGALYSLTFSFALVATIVISILRS